MVLRLRRQQLGHRVLNSVVLVGQGHDTLEGASGDDILIGCPGADLLKGGSGKNSYLLQGNDEIQGSDGVDVIYIRRPKANVNLTNCSRNSCQASDSKAYNGDPAFSSTITKGDVLIFLDGREVLS